MLIHTEEWITVPEAARLLGVSQQRAHKLATDGLVESVRPWGRVMLVRLADVEARAERMRKS